MTKAPPRRPTGGTRSAASVARVERHLQIAAADEVLTVDGVELPLRPQRRKGARLIFWVGIPLVVIAGFAALFIVPTKSWLNQKRQYKEATIKLQAVKAANAQFDEQIAALQTDEEIIRIARARYNLVRNGDQVMAVLPSPVPYPLPNEWPYTLLQDIVTIRLQHPETMPGTGPATTVKPGPTTVAPIVSADAAPTTSAADTAETPETTTAP
jgi:cell division protein FtsB